MAEGLDAASFEFYEGIRIIIPGALTVGLADAVVRTAHPDGHGLGLTALPTVVAAIVVGLLLYFVDVPTKTPYFRADQPTATLAQFGTPKGGLKIGNLFWVILDREMPPGIKARALYMGSIYRIGYETVCLLALASSLVLSQHLWSTTKVRVAPDKVPLAVWLGIGAAAWLIALAVRVDTKANARRTKEHRAQGRPTGLHRPDLIFVAVAVVAMAGLLVASSWRSMPRWTLVIPAGAALWWWAVRYYKGYSTTAPATRKGSDTRVAASALRAALLLATSNVLLAIATIGSPVLDGWLDRREHALWTATQIVALALVVARGHERQLGGAYATQRTWLEIERDRLKPYFNEDA